jgi:alkylated DNA nucleotide flippase Atl1
MMGTVDTLRGATDTHDRPSFAEEVLDLVDRIPPGRVLTYGAIREILGRGSAVGVGGVMARDGHAVAWWRVVRADGALAPHLVLDAQEHWRLEGTPMVGGIVDIGRAMWDGEGGLEQAFADAEPS